MNKKIKNLVEEIESIIKTSPLEIAINNCQIDNYKKSLKKIADSNLNAKNRHIEKKLSEMGLSNSNNALGATISLARERTEMNIDIERKVNEYAIQTKKNILDSKQSILGVLIQERDKKRHLIFNYFQALLTSGVIVTVLNIFSNEIKSIFLIILKIMAKYSS
jgi:hypothetical protein